MVKYPLKWF